MTFLQYRFNTYSDSLVMLLNVCVLFIYGCTETPAKALHKNDSERIARTNVLTHDFGVVNPGEVCRHRFILKNDTNSPVDISSVRTVCACTIAALESNRIGSHGETAIEVVYTASTKRTDTQKSVHVVTTDKNRNDFELVILAKVRPSLSPTDNFLSFGEISETGPPPSRIVRVENYSDELIRDLQITSSPPFAKCTLIPVKADQVKGSDSPLQAWDLLINIIAGLSVGEHSGAIILQQKEKPVRYHTSLAVTAKVSAGVRAIPAVVFIPTIVVGKELKRTLNIRNSSNQLLIPNEIKVIHDLDAFLDVTTDISENSINLRIIAKEPGHFQGTLLLTLPDIATLPIPISVIAIK